MLCAFIEKRKEQQSLPLFIFTFAAFSMLPIIVDHACLSPSPHALLHFLLPLTPPDAIDYFTAVHD